MRIALAQLNYLIGDFDGNVSKIIESVRKCREMNADLVVFAELSLCGYPPRDFLEFDDFINRCGLAIEQIAAECHGIAAIIGAPARNPDIKGKNLFNAAWLLADGDVKGMAFKALLPNYDIFDEYRYFEPNRSFNVLEFNGVKIALTVCEDIWNIGPDPLYVATPMDELIRQQPDIMINIAASPFNSDQESERAAVLATNARQYRLP
ncbi:MAG TPA: nitrilase-related carbon-nitrogen hydrolase, partial [Bacteroidales bacterium]|nr:nitrilase-related carbon-nitrogen hydrolase [Bacteroidales bacterium]